MADITVPRDNGRILGEHEFSDPVKAGVHLIKGAMYGVDANGFAIKGTSGNVVKMRGEVLYSVDNSAGADGAKRVRGRAGIFAFHIDGASAVTRADLYSDVYALDDQTVSRTSNAGARPKAGRLYDVVGIKALVRVGDPEPNSGDLASANNLSDVANAATSRSNLGANKLYFHIGTISTKASDAAVLRAPAPMAGTLLKIFSVMNGALATGDATLQAKVNGANAGSTTTGLATLTQAASAAGDVDSASPVTTNVALVANDLITVTCGGASTATATAEVYVEMSY